MGSAASGAGVPLTPSREEPDMASAHSPGSVLLYSTGDAYLRHDVTHGDAGVRYLGKIARRIDGIEIAQAIVAEHFDDVVFSGAWHTDPAEEMGIAYLFTLGG